MSYVPKPEADGLRRYNQWAGNPAGRQEDTTRCVVSVTPNERGGFIHTHQCLRKRGHGPGGLYCKQHDPAAVNARYEASIRRYDAQAAARNRPNVQREAFRKALEAIAGGHNDPRALARDVLEKNQ